MFTSYTLEDLNSFKSNSENVSQVKSTENLIEKYQLEKCVNWIKENNYQRTCLQFPENLLNDSTSIAIYLQNTLDRVVYVLADTAYGSCCVDEVAAEHVNGDSIIHFGHGCLTPVCKLPVLYVFEKRKLDLEKLYHEFEIFSGNQVVVFYSDVYRHLFNSLCNRFKDSKNVSISRLNLDGGPIESTEKIACGRVFSSNLNSQSVAVYLGEDSVTLQNLVLQLSGFKWYQYNEEKLLEYEINRNKFLMQRFHLVEKIRSGNVLGILIGTLGIKNFLDAIERVKLLGKKNGKKCYILAIGKPNVAKLANFPEIDVFVCIACQENSLLKDFKGYYKPIVSLFEVEMALNDRSYDAQYVSDFRELLPGGSFHTEIISSDEKNVSSKSDDSQELMIKDPGTIVESAGADYLSNRTWRGLEQNIGETEVAKAVKGRTGIPQAYENEFSTLSSENRT